MITDEYRPTSEDEAARIIAECGQAGRTMRFVGGRTKLNLGNPVGQVDALISTLALADLVDYQPEDLTITVGAGLEFDRLQHILGEQGQFLPLDPPALPGQTVGGVLATNRSGPRRLLYGTARDLLIGCRFVLADGSQGHSGGRVVKNVAGYDLHKLFIGAYGTLGLLTEVTFKVVPKPQVVGAGAARFQTAQAAFQAARQCVRSNLMPAALVVTAEPEGGYSLYFGAEGVGIAVEGQLAGLGEICRQAGADAVDLIEDGQSLWARLVNQWPEPGAPHALLLKASTLLTEMPRLSQRLESLAASSGLSCHQMAYAGTGISYFYFNPLSEVSPDLLVDIIKKARIEAGHAGGSLTIENAPLAVRQQVDSWGDMGDALPAMQALRRKLDPQGRLSPGVMDLGLVPA